MNSSLSSIQQKKAITCKRHGAQVASEQSHVSDMERKQQQGKYDSSTTRFLEKQQKSEVQQKSVRLAKTCQEVTSKLINN